MSETAVQIRNGRQPGDRRPLHHPERLGRTSYVTTYAYDMLNHLTGVSLPHSSGTQTRAFNYTSGTTVGALLLSLLILKTAPSPTPTTATTA